MKNKEIETRGIVLALSLRIEDCLNRILYNFFSQKSKDEDTRNIFLKNFILPLTFGQKVSLYKQVLNTGRYQGKVMEKLKTVQDFPVRDLSSFVKVVQKNLAEIISTRNYVAHGIEISNLFLTPIDDEVVFIKKTDIIKFSKESIEEFSQLVLDTYKLLEITDGILSD